MGFKIQSLSDSRVSEMTQSDVWNPECPAHHTRLFEVHVRYVNFDGEEQSGILIVLDEVAEAVSKIFKEIYETRFPVFKIKTAEEYQGDDIKLMETNITSAFNGRRIMNTDRWSSHAFGVAIDINPCQNPYLKIDTDQSLIKVYPSNGIHFVNRGIKKRGMTEEIKEIFFNYGFTEWGGEWDDRPDYHHFQLPWKRIRELFPEHSFQI